MRNLVYYIATTIDGFIAPPGGGDPSGEAYFPITPDLMTFIVANYPETLPAPARAALGIDDPGTAFDTVVEGRRSYEIGVAAGLTDAYPHLRHLVFSTSMAESPDDRVELVRDNALERIGALKSEDGKDIWLLGGGELAHALLPEIDTLVLKVNPWIIGAGVPLFSGGFRPTAFRKVGEKPLDGGVRVVTYDRV